MSEYFLAVSRACVEQRHFVDGQEEGFHKRKFELHIFLSGEEICIKCLSMAGDDYSSIVEERIASPSEVFDVYEVLSTEVDRVGEEFSMNDDQLFETWSAGLALYGYIGFVVGGGIMLNLILIKGILQAKYSGKCINFSVLGANKCIKSAKLTFFMQEV